MSEMHITYTGSMDNTMESKILTHLPLDKMGMLDNLTALVQIKA